MVPIEHKEMSQEIGHIQISGQNATWLISMYHKFFLFQAAMNLNEIFILKSPKTLQIVKCYKISFDCSSHWCPWASGSRCEE